MLEVEDLCVSYGGIQAVRGASFQVKEGETATLIGSNGAGKTTILNALCGVLPSTGRIIYRGEAIHGLRTDRIVAKGIVMVAEGRRIFPRLTVEKNLFMGAYARRVAARELAEDMAAVYELFPRLKERRRQTGGTMSGGEQQMLAIGRALMGKPKLLLLDEPSMGLAPIVIKDIYDTIRKIKRQGMTILLVEQNASMALSVADRGYLIEHGEIIQADSAARLRQNDAVKKSYLGK